MGLPRIPSYDLPTAADLPAARVGWQPDPARAVLLVHDLQNHFLDAFDRGRAPVPQLLGTVARIAAQCRALGVPVVYTAQPGGQTPEQRGLLQDFWGDGVPPGGRATAIADEVAPADGDVLLTKWRYSAFQRTGLRELLADLGRDQLVVCGIYAHIGCLMTACDAFMQDVQPFLVADAVADFSADHHAEALCWAASRCAVTLTADALLGSLARVPA
ncbi:isochorismatase family protein [Kineococcus glutinatus]|uniref:Isochorismatase-like domain-containing protein n=1 Tax=Kineococcus glutinatus TaxID=1070872 RepID=A0ABP9HD03_9ACTN